MEAQPFSDLLLVTLVAFLAPLLLGLAPRLRLPAVVLEIVAGIAIGPSGLGWVEVSEPVAVLALIGLAFLLFLAGLEIDLGRLRGPVLKLAAGGFAMSFAIAVALALALGAAGLVSTPLLVAIVLSATSLGVVIPVLKDAGESESTFGQLVIAAASIADFATIVLLSLFFSREGTGLSAQLILLGSFAVLVVALFFAVRGAERSRRVSDTLVRLQDTTAQIRVRGAFLLLIVFVALAEQLGLEVILGAFAAGAVLTLLDRDREMTHPEFRHKLEAIGFGVFIPAFFVTSGLRFDLQALFADPAALAMIPIFLAALLLVRGLPALPYRKLIGGRRTAVAGLLQATSLPFIVASTQIGLELGMIGEAEAASLVAAGLVSVIVFPLTSLGILGGARTGEVSAGAGYCATSPAARRV